MNIGLVVGHNYQKQGAKNYKEESEYCFNCSIAERVKANLYYSGIQCHVFKKDTAPSILSADIKYIKPTFLIELHFNAFCEETFGSEILILDRAKDRGNLIYLAKKLLRYHNDIFGIEERGIKYLMEGDRGFRNLEFYDNCEVPLSMIFEPCFANFRNEQTERFFNRESIYISMLSCYLASLV